MSRLTFRILDVIYAVGLGLLLSPLILAVALIVLWREGPPVFYGSERMHDPVRSFTLWKFRTMCPAERDGGVTGGDKAARITSTGKWLRRTRLDELPQIWNILRGDVGFVGPRPPLRRYVEMFPDLYDKVLAERPGVTGLASQAFHAHEERLLSGASTPEHTEDIYCRRCIPRKARLDLIYVKSRTPCSDMRLMFATVFGRVTMHDRKGRQ
ncbi:sugar transferase [Sagittula sp. MA-2]|jgi:lipopolysaccharide/colanic/teichoic acid biosynthesis glycosyltransferase|uniref:sugar transferase n=1 Tax=Sagittula sp. MA-2 TaxID=3048007 RepID=UPI0024C31A6B|nr:sugar transferase [Sagittula sp. MA-2]WHZ35174.1 sugar transferase [Sagittula sp. MA-2]